MKNCEIRPLRGYGEINFGMSINDIVSILGEPTNHEALEPLIEDNENNSILYEYDDDCLSLYFEGVTKNVVASISTNNEDALLFGERIYDMNINQILELMRRNGYKEYEEEDQDGDTCIIFDELMLDFYFKDGDLIDVLWGVIVDSHGNLI